MSVSDPPHPSSKRILEIGRDPLFAVASPHHTDWVSTGRPIEPLHRHLGPPDVPAIPLREALRRLRRGHYDLVMVPATKAVTPTDQSRLRTVVRRGLTLAAQNERLVDLVSGLTGLREVPHLVRDISDYPNIGDSDAGLFPGSQVYAKREVLEHDLGGQAHGDRGGIVTYLPMAFHIERYREWMADDPAKTTDVFFAGKLHSRHRMIAKHATEKLAETGYIVDFPTERLSYLEYLEHLSQAWLVLSPKGHGEHCYRHYETLLMGSVPVINRPDLPIHYSLQDEKTALFHEPNVDALVRRCSEALEDRPRLRQIAAAGRELVESEHDTQAISEGLLALSLMS